MSSLRNAVPKRTYKERSQLQSRSRFGFLEKHKDYVIRAKAYHTKQQKLQKLKEKAAFRNPDEFNFKMTRTRTVNGVHMPENPADKRSRDEILLLKSREMSYVLQELQSEKKRLEKLSSTLHFLDAKPQRRHVYFAEDRQEAKEIASKIPENNAPISSDIPDDIRRNTESSYVELEATRKRVNQLENVYMDMVLQRELQKKGRKRKLHEDELIVPTSKPVYNWRPERKR